MIATGDEVGLVEVVTNAETIGEINRLRGGSMSVLKDDTITRWLKEQNPDDRDLRQAITHFTLSAAGYCVATYVLGIGDRHNDSMDLS